MNTDGNKNNEEASEEEPAVESVIRVNDHGSDLTDRFKYKVNALMGNFDPQTGVDDERQDGNILNGRWTTRGCTGKRCFRYLT